MNDNHTWPKDGEHLWGPWMNKTAPPKPTEYRQCVHPKCRAVETRTKAQA